MHPSLPVLVISVVCLSFLGWYSIAFSGSLQQWFRNRFSGTAGQERWIFFKRLCGVFFFILIPALVYAIATGIPIPSWMNVQKGSGILLYGIGLSLILISVNLLAGRHPVNLAMYPEIRTPLWSGKLLAASALSWIVYLGSYEFMFRGFLLFPLALAYGKMLAITVNTAMYAFAHLQKGLREALGAIPLGVVLCLISLDTGSIWAACIAHSSLAISNEWVALSAHPDIKLKKFSE